MLIIASALHGPLREQPPGNAEVKELSQVSDPEGSTAMPPTETTGNGHSPGIGRPVRDQTDGSPTNLSGFMREGHTPSMV